MKKIPYLLMSILFVLCMSGCNRQQITERETTSEEITPVQTDIRIAEETAPTKEPVYYTALFPVCIDGKYEYIDTEGSIVTGGQYDCADFFYDGMGIVKKDGMMGAVNQEGSLIIPCKYKELKRFSCGVALAENEEGKKGYIDKEGNVVIPFQYEFARDFSENIAIVSKGEGDLYEFIDLTGNVVAKVALFENINWGDFQDGLMLNGYSYYNARGECVLEDVTHVLNAAPLFPGSFSGGYAVVPKLKEEVFQKENYLDNLFDGRNWCYVFIDTSGKDVFNKYFDSAYGFSEGYAVVEENGQIGVIDTTGEFVFCDNRLEFGACREGCFLFSEKEDEVWKFGFLNTEGEVEIPAQYYKVYYNSSCQGFCNGLCLVAQDEERRHLMYINHQNECVYRFEVWEER